ncbi:hypothetical protein Daus18300_005734 [Diaporthe australafricana]|uniref:Uncharacterized protein n=1 Tax=Diaporthe australafricana TaxID=127596 RepID=A0ABR3WZ51_9PEZI
MTFELAKVLIKGLCATVYQLQFVEITDAVRLEYTADSTFILKVVIEQAQIVWYLHLNKWSDAGKKLTNVLTTGQPIARAVLGPHERDQFPGPRAWEFWLCPRLGTAGGMSFSNNLGGVSAGCKYKHEMARVLSPSRDASASMDGSAPGGLEAQVDDELSTVPHQEDQQRDRPMAEEEAAQAAEAARRKAELQVALQIAAEKAKAAIP